MTNVNYRFLKIYFVRRVTGSSVWQSSFPHYYGTNTENSELLVHSYGYLDTARYFYDCLVIMLRRQIKRRLISPSPSSESTCAIYFSCVKPTNAVTLPCIAAILSAILEFVIGFVSNFYNTCALSLRTIQRKN